MPRSLEKLVFVSIRTWVWDSRLQRKPSRGLTSIRNARSLATSPFEGESYQALWNPPKCEGPSSSDAITCIMWRNIKDTKNAMETSQLTSRLASDAKKAILWSSENAGTPIRSFHVLQTCVPGHYQRQYDSTFYVWFRRVQVSVRNSRNSKHLTEL